MLCGKNISQKLNAIVYKKACFLDFSYLYTDRADHSSLSLPFQSAVEPFIKVLEYPATKGTTPARAVQLIQFNQMILASNDHNKNVIEKNDYFAHYVLQVNSYFKLLCYE